MPVLCIFYYFNNAVSRFLQITLYAVMHITTDMHEPIVDAIPIGSRLSVQYFAAKYDMGIRASKMDAQLCAKEIPDLLQAQKYPLKQK